MGVTFSLPHPRTIPKEKRQAVLGLNSLKDKPSLEKIATLIREGKAKKIMFLCGAGISVSAGIPDFRTPGTGLYDNLSEYNLPKPEAVKNPVPFYKLSKEIMPQPKKYKPTRSHFFMKLCEEKNVLLRVFTQNIDCLERLTGIHASKLVECHGTYATCSCIECSEPFETQAMKEAFIKGDIVTCRKCGGLVKPDITFFGESLPERFAECRDKDENEADLLIVMGTSLQVHPVAGLADSVDILTPRVLINREMVHVLAEDSIFTSNDDHDNGSNDVHDNGSNDDHDIDSNDDHDNDSNDNDDNKNDKDNATTDPGFRFHKEDNYRDVFVQGNCDDGVYRLCELIGENWLKRLIKLENEFDPDTAQNILLNNETTNNTTDNNHKKNSTTNITNDNNNTNTTNTTTDNNNNNNNTTSNNNSNTTIAKDDNDITSHSKVDELVANVEKVSLSTSSSSTDT